MYKERQYRNLRNSEGPTGTIMVLELSSVTIGHREQCHTTDTRLLGSSQVIA